MIRNCISSLIIVFLSSCTDINTEKEKPIQKQAKTGDEMNYPYRADPERRKRIETGTAQLELGMTKEKVLNVMGKPDEINDTFDKDNWDRKIGYSFVYIKQRDAKHGSVEEKNEELIRVHFNLKDRVRKIIKIGDGYVKTKGSIQDNGTNVTR